MKITGKPCPFCGKDKLSLDCKSKNESKGYYRTYTVRCNSCFARGGTVSGYISAKRNWNVTIISDSELQQKAIELWNTRAEGN